MTTTLDELIRDKLGDAGNLQKFADKCGVSVRALCDLRRGLVKRPHEGTVRALAGALGVSRAAVRAALSVA